MGKFLTIRPNFKKGDVIKKDITTYNGTFKAGSKVTNPKKINDALTFSMRVIGDVSVERNYKVTETQVYKDNENFAPFVFSDTGKADFSFNVKAAMKNNTIGLWLDYLYTNNIPVSIVVDTPFLLNMMYRITEASERTIVRRGYSEWDLRFTAYYDINVLRKYVNNQKKVSSTAQKVKKCTLKKWKKKQKITFTVKGFEGKRKVTGKYDYNDCNKIITKILYKKGFLKKKYVGKNWDVFYLKWYKKKVTKSPIKDTEGHHAYLVQKNVVGKVYPCKRALKKFQKKWNKKKLKPHLKENGKKDKKTLKALKRYKEL